MRTIPIIPRKASKVEIVTEPDVECEDGSVIPVSQFTIFDGVAVTRKCPTSQLIDFLCVYNPLHPRPLTIKGRPMLVRNP